MKRKILFTFLGIFILVATLFIINLNNTKSQDNVLDNIQQYEEDLKQIECYCGCDDGDLYECYEEGMLTNCGICMNEYETYLELKDEKTIEEISDIIDEKYETYDHE